jgi:hypothetical protein
MVFNRDNQKTSNGTLSRSLGIALFAIFLVGVNLANVFSVPTLDQRLRTMRGVYPEPSLPRLPPAGGKFTDQTFGTEILRATDERDDSVGLSTYYSHWPTFNRDNTYILVKKGLSGDALIKTFNSEAFSVGSGYQPGPVNIPGKGNVSINFESAIWHPTDPHLIYCFPLYYEGGMRLFTFNVVTRRYALVKNFGSLATHPTDYLKQMYMSADGDVFAWLQMSVRTGSSKVHAFLVWRKSTDAVLAHTVDSYVGGINEVHVDKSGKYVSIHLNQAQPNASRTRFLNLQTGTVEFLYQNERDRPTGHGDLGTGTIVGFDNYACGIHLRRLNAIHSPELQFSFKNEKGTADWTNDFHGTLLADNEDWITIGTYFDPAVPLPSTGVFKDEIMQVALDGSGRFRRICHTRSAIDNKTEASGYWAMPKPTISRDGRFIAFTSNWEKSGRFDVFIARITPAPILFKGGR